MQARQQVCERCGYRAPGPSELSEAERRVVETAVARDQAARRLANIPVVYIDGYTTRPPEADAFYEADRAFRDAVEVLTLSK